jgi:hypothetical protein
MGSAVHIAIPPTPEYCILEHPVFVRLGEVLFRRSTSDGTPVVIVPMGEREALVPLRSLQREFAIPDDSADGRMLGLIAESLDFVNGLHPGDKLPAEVLSGHASWEPRSEFRTIASTRLKMQLLRWLDPETLAGEPGRDPATARRLNEDPRMRAKVQAAFAKAAAELGLDSSEAVVSGVTALAEELAYIEALRHGLLRRVQQVHCRLERLGQGTRGDGQRAQTLTQVRRMVDIALRKLALRFDEVDMQTGEVIAALRNAESQHAFVRSNRDWLYRCQRAWEPILALWDAAAPVLDESSWALINKTYQFLAPRYMPVMEWQASREVRQSRRNGAIERAMTW